MNMNPEFMKELIATFQSELDEGLQVITEGLLWLEKNGTEQADSDKTIERIFRSAHNIKGAASGVGVHAVADIAHHIESLFSSIQKRESVISGQMINVCLEAVDNMRGAMQSFVTQKPPSFDQAEFVKRMKAIISNEPVTEKTFVKDSPNQAVPEPVYREYESIRVELTSLDKVSALMEEMQVSKISIDDHYAELSHFSSKLQQFIQLWKKGVQSLRSQGGAEMSDTLQKMYGMSHATLTEIEESSRHLQKNMRLHINDFSILSNSLQEEIRMLRLVPVSTLLSTFPRLVRDLAIELNKNVNLVIKGGEVKMDKLVLEGLKDPLIHLLRNAVDHGMETPEERRAAGKAETGQIRLSVKEEGNQILFHFSDDGRGIDLDKVGRSAIKKNIISEAELDAMDEAEKLDLIFRPGFSTKDDITSVSGRGVGLDVVKDNIHRLNGHVRVETDFGKKTDFILQVPLTLASERGLIVKVSGHAFALSVTSVEKVLIIPKEEIVEVEASQAILLDHRAVPLRILSDTLGMKPIEQMASEKLAVVVVKNDWQMVALLVDEILGEREIVIKPLQAPVANIDCVAGGTLAGNGQVIVVLDSKELIEAALQSQTHSRIARKDDMSKSRVAPHILVVDDSITTRTLEKNILESRGYQVTVAVNGKEAWTILQNGKFSLLITDVSMPVMDGFTLTEKVKKSQTLNKLPVIIVTSMDSDAEKKRGIDAGADAYIIKNQFESGVLLDIVSQLV